MDSLPAKKGIGSDVEQSDWKNRPNRMPSHHEIDSFIRATFRSVWTLELLCLLRQNRSRSLSPAEMVVALRASDLVVSSSLAALTAAGLVADEADGSVRYKPASGELDDLVEQAAVTYGRSPDAVRRMIVSAANPGITAFADAFRLRKD